MQLSERQLTGSLASQRIALHLCGRRKCMPKFKRWLCHFNDVQRSLIYHICPLVIPFETNLQMTTLKYACMCANETIPWPHLLGNCEYRDFKHIHTHIRMFTKREKIYSQKLYVWVFHPYSVCVCILADPFAIALELHFSVWSNDAAGMQWILFHLKFITG